MNDPSRTHEQSDRHAAGSSLKDRAVIVGAFAFTFAIVAACLSLTLRAAEPEPDLIVLSPKLEYFQDHHARFNTVFLGTSRTFYHILPDAVETGAEREGCPGLRVYNFGVFGLNGAEQDWLLDKILEIEGLRLDFLIIEDPLPAERKLNDVTSERARYFHQPGLYRAYLEDILSFPESRPKQAFRTGIFGYGVVYDLSGVGRLSKAVFPPAKPPRPIGFDFSNEGFEALGSITNADIDARREAFQSNPEKFTRNLEQYDRGPEADPRARARYHARRLERIASAGIQAGLFISPDTAEVRRTGWIGKAVEDLRPDVLNLNYNIPPRFPELFDRSKWFDFSHLNLDGARVLSLNIGERICADLKAKG